MTPNPNKHQDILLEAIEQTYRLARIDPATGEILPVEVACKSLLEQICSAYAIPPEALGEPCNTNHMSGEAQQEAYKQMIFGKRSKKQ